MRASRRLGRAGRGHSNSRRCEERVAVRREPRCAFATTSLRFHCNTSPRCARSRPSQRLHRFISPYTGESSSTGGCLVSRRHGSVQDHLKALQSRVLSFPSSPRPGLKLKTATRRRPPSSTISITSLKIWMLFHYGTNLRSGVDDVFRTAQNGSLSSRLYRAFHRDMRRDRLKHYATYSPATAPSNLSRVGKCFSSSLPAGWAGIIKSRSSLSGLRGPPEACACRLVVATRR
jgi:hypothetical protein